MKRIKKIIEEVIGIPLHIFVPLYLVFVVGIFLIVPTKNGMEILFKTTIIVVPLIVYFNLPRTRRN